MSTALRFLGLLGRARLAKRRIHARLHRLATKHGEKCGLKILGYTVQGQVIPLTSTNSFFPVKSVRILPIKALCAPSLPVEYG